MCPWSSPGTNHSLAFPSSYAAECWWCRREVNTEHPSPFQSSVWKGGKLVTLTVLLKGPGCLGVPYRAEGEPSMTLCFLQKCSAELQLCAGRPKVWEGFRNPIPSLCCRYLSVCILCLWAPSKCATTKGISPWGDRQHHRHLLLTLPLSPSCIRQFLSNIPITF